MFKMLKVLFLAFWEGLKAFFPNLFSKTAKWLSQDVKGWLLPVLKVLGVASAGAVTFTEWQNFLDQAKDKFGFVARLLQIDDVFNSINNALLSWSAFTSVCDSSFNEMAGAFGLVSAINEILNTCGICIVFALVMLLARWITGGIAKVVMFTGMKRL